MKERQRKYLTDSVTEFCRVCLPDFDVNRIESGLSLIGDADLILLWREIFVLVTTDDVLYAAEVCSRHGWFIEMDFPGRSAPLIADLYNDGKPERADSLLMEYYRGRCDAIEDELVHRYPARAAILSKAFRSHFNHEYEVSVPLFLIQADGICADAFGKEFFRVKRKTLAAGKSILQRKVDWIWSAMAQPFRMVPSVAADSRKPRPFNRNRILHGASLNYGTEVNSLRAISLLAFLHGMYCYAQNHAMRSDSMANDAIGVVSDLCELPAVVGKKE